jgi:hypothetical protein
MFYKEPPSFWGGKAELVTFSLSFVNWARNIQATKKEETMVPSLAMYGNVLK